MSDVLRPVPFDVPAEHRATVIQQLNGWLPALIDLALCLKQAHWNLRGSRFKSVHEQLDEILEIVREGVDDVAERVVTVGGAADGRPAVVAEKSGLGEFPDGLLTVEQAVEDTCSHMSKVIQKGRGCIEELGKVDPVSEDLAIGVVGGLEKQFWMLHSQLDKPSS